MEIKPELKSFKTQYLKKFFFNEIKETSSQTQKYQSSSNRIYRYILYQRTNENQNRENFLIFNS